MQRLLGVEHRKNYVDALIGQQTVSLKAAVPSESHDERAYIFVAPVVHLLLWPCSRGNAHSL